MQLHYLQHVPFETIAGIGDWATSRGHTVSGTQLFAEEFTHPGDFDFLVVMGGPMNIYEEAEYPWLAEEKAFIASAVEAGKLVLGVCLGAQLVADVLGGPVTPGPQPEIGWYPVELTEAGRELGCVRITSGPVRALALAWGHVRYPAGSDPSGA